jgi:hypothetical protein
MRKHVKVLGIMSVLVLALGACDSSSKSSDKTDTTDTTVTPTAVTITVTPSTALTEGQTVQVTGAKFPPNEYLVIGECAGKSADPPPGDCDIAHLGVVRADAQGNVTGGKSVTKGPFGGNNIVCSAEHPCFVVLSELAVTPKKAEKGITFAG